MSRRPAAHHRSGGPHLALIPAGASAQEAAAIVAALEQFVRDSAPAPASPQEPDRWTQAALQEGCSREPGKISRDPWINT